MSRFIATLICSFFITMLSCAAEPNDSIVSDDEFELWLSAYATPIDSTTVSAVPEKHDTVGMSEEPAYIGNIADTFGDVSFAVDSLSLLSGDAGTIELPETSVSVLPVDSEVISYPESLTLSDTESVLEPDPEYFAEDSFALYKENRSVVYSNPMFLDWVFGDDTDAVSLSLTDDDSIVVALRCGAKEYIRHTAPELYDYHKTQLPKATDIKNRRIKNSSPDNLALHSDRLNKIQSEVISKATPDLPFWVCKAKFELHMTQGYISPNWYQGGESNLSGKVYVMGAANYNDNNKIQWDNKIEWKLTLNSAGSDTLRMFRVDEDQIHINSKLGYKAFDNFFYTAEADFQSSFFNTYKPGTYIRTSGLFSPIRMNVSFGIDYKYKDKLSVLLSPLSFKMLYVMDTTYHASVLPTENIPHQVGITDGSNSLYQLGALLRVGWKHKFNDSIGMELKFSFFGNYVGKRKGIETDCELIGDFRINRFLTAKVSLNPRYDSTVEAPDGKKTKLQFKELISFGFCYVI